MASGLSSRQLLPQLLLLLIGCCHLGAAFYPVADDAEFLTNDEKAKADMDRMMLMNTDDPKLRAEAEEAFKEILAAKRLSKLQECRRTCVNEHEDAAVFRGCNAECEATHKPGEYGELPILRGQTGPEAEAEKANEAKKAAAESGDQQTKKSGEL